MMIGYDLQIRVKKSLNHKGYIQSMWGVMGQLFVDQQQLWSSKLSSGYRGLSFVWPCKVQPFHISEENKRHQVVWIGFDCGVNFSFLGLLTSFVVWQDEERKSDFGFLQQPLEVVEPELFSLEIFLLTSRGLHKATQLEISKNNSSTISMRLENFGLRITGFTSPNHSC